jgi:CrcB protein
LRFFLICLGGAVGTAARYLTTMWAVARFGSAFPAGTLIVNVAGSFLIAFIMQMSMSGATLSDDVRLMLTTGVMGGFTTYSAFNYETTTYLRDGAWSTAVLNVAATLLGCMAAGFAGLALARAVGSR